MASHIPPGSPSLRAHIRNLQDHRIPTLPPSAYYIPDFITEGEEDGILNKITTAPLPRWKTLSHRRLQAYPSPLTPSSNTLLSAPLPDWLSEPIIERVRGLVLAPSASSSSSAPSSPPPPPSSSLKEEKEGKEYEEEAKPSKQQQQQQHIFSSAPHQAPNHVLVNEYLPGQGILPHEDGDAYYPVVVTVSLGGAVVLDIYRKGTGTAKEKEKAEEKEKEPGEGKGEGSGREPEWRILQERRSLLITADEMYTDYLHGIRGVEVDEGIGEDGVVNWELVVNKEEFQDGRNVRGTRVSLTFRDVVRVKNFRKAFGFARS